MVVVAAAMIGLEERMVGVVAAALKAVENGRRRDIIIQRFTE